MLRAFYVFGILLCVYGIYVRLCGHLSVLVDLCMFMLRIARALYVYVLWFMCVVQLRR